MNSVKSIPDIKLPGLQLNTESFTAELIKYEKDDTKEIKQLIQKINKKIACHTCDHSKFEKLSISYAKDVIQLRNSKNLSKCLFIFDENYSRVKSNPKINPKSNPVKILQK